MSLPGPPEFQKSTNAALDRLRFPNRGARLERQPGVGNAVRAGVWGAGRVAGSDKDAAQGTVPAPQPWKGSAVGGRKVFASGKRRLGVVAPGRRPRFPQVPTRTLEEGTRGLRLFCLFVSGRR